jgi:hypothetical protein
MLKHNVRRVLRGCFCAAVVSCSSASGMQDAELTIEKGDFNDRDSVRLYDFRVQQYDEKTKIAEAIYLKKDYEGFADAWFSMAASVQGTDFLNTIRTCSQTELNELCEKIQIWLGVTNKRACRHFCYCDDRRTEIAQQILSAGMNIQSDLSAIQYRVAYGLVLFAQYADSSINSSITCNRWNGKS